MAQITWERFDRGLKDGYWDSQSVFSDTPLAINDSVGFLSDGTHFPFYAPNVLIPGTNESTSFTQTNQLTGTEIAGFEIVDNDHTELDQPAVYLVESAKLHAVDNETTPQIMSASDGNGDFPHSVSNATMRDIVHWELQEGGTLGRYILYFYTLSTGGGNMGSYNMFAGSSNVFDDTVWSDTTDGATTDFDENFDIIAEPSENSFLYVLNANRVHRFDGSSSAGNGGAVKPDVLILANNRVFVDAADGNGVMWLGTQDAGGSTGGARDIRILAWNRFSSSIGVKSTYRIHDANLLHAVFLHQGIPACITTGIDDVTQFRLFSGNTFKVVANLGQGVPPQNKNGVIPYGLGTLIHADNGVMMYYGRAKQDSPDEGVFRLGSVTNPGAVVRARDSAVFAGAVRIWDPYDLVTTVDTKEPKILLGAVPLPKISTITGLYMEYLSRDAGSFSSVTFTIDVYGKYDALGSGDSEIQFTWDPSTAKGAKKGYQYFPLNIQGCNIAALELTYLTAINRNSVPLFTRFIIEYEPETRKV